MQFISGSSNRPLAEKIALLCRSQMMDVRLDKFTNGEKRVWIADTKVDNELVIVQSFSDPVDEHIMEVFLLIDAIRRKGVKKISLAIPWFGYSLQDKAFRSGEPISAEVIAKLISSTEIDQVFLLDLHNSRVQKFFTIPTVHLSAVNIFAEYIKERFDLADCVAVSPDFGGIKRARILADKLDLPLVTISKQRDRETGKVKAGELEGNVEGKIALMFDDGLVTGSTLVQAAKVLEENGAKRNYFFATHGILVELPLSTINQAKVEAVVITDSIYHKNINKKIEILNTAPLFADALKRRR